MSVQRLCKTAGISRQGFYKAHRCRARQAIREDVLYREVHTIRRYHGRMGGRKLLVKLAPVLEEHGISIGRDRFFDFLRRNRLLIVRPRRRPQTTDSRHRMPVYPNLIKDREPIAPHQIWVSDITYIQTRQGFLYLSLITDAYSRKIVGYHANDNLEAEGCLKALRMAIRQLPDGRRPIHHSDRGSQYCSLAYTRLLDKHHARISMTEQNHCYENSLAERVNGILKQEYALGQVFPDKSIARTACAQAVRLYNNDRPHLSLAMGIPALVHETGQLWKHKCVNL